MHGVVEIHGRADCVCAAPGRGWNTGGGGVPQDGHVGGDLLPLEAIVRRLGTIGAAQDALLEEENKKLKRLVADPPLDKAMLQEVLAQKV